MKRTVMVRYKTSSETHAAANETLVHAVFDELRANKPAGVNYATYKLSDGVTFVHVATLDGADVALTELPSFKAFQKQLKDRCVELPLVTEMTVVDSFRPSTS
jgi:hypothetical protein